jgi:hypothetical protein
VHTVVIGGIATHFLLNSMTTAHSALKRSRQNAFWLTYSGYLILLYSLPGSSSAQLSMVAATHMFAAIAFWSHAARKPEHVGVLVAFSAASLAFAVSIRPNYAFTAPVLAIIGLAPLFRSFNRPSVFYVAKQLALFGAVCLMVFCAQFIPYVLVPGGSKILAQALVAIAEFSSAGTNLADLFRDEIFNDTAGFYIALYVGLAALYLQAISNGGRLPAEIHVCLLSTIGLNFSFVRTHYYGHYTPMFVPFAVILFAHVLLEYSQEQFNSAKKPSGIAKKSTATVAFLMLSLIAAPAITVVVALYDFVRHADRIDFSINDRNIDHDLVRFLKDIKPSGLSFYAPSETTYHRLFGEGRIGDGHPAMLSVVLGGKRVGPIGNIPLYGEEVHQTPCLAILQSGKDIIFIKRDDDLSSEVKNCLESEGTTYRRIVRFDGLPVSPWTGSGNAVLAGHDVYFAPTATSALNPD